MNSIIQLGKPGERIRVYRGDYPGKLGVILQYGVRAKERSLIDGLLPEMQMQMMALPGTDLVVTMHGDVLRHHVLNESRNSPLVSFSTDRNIALKWAFGNWSRQDGLLIVADILVAAKYSWEALPIWGRDAVQDLAGRHWFFVPSCYFPDEDYFSPAPRIMKFLRNGIRDREFLMLGQLSPTEITVYRIHWDGVRVVLKVVDQTSRPPVRGRGRRASVIYV